MDSKCRLCGIKKPLNEYVITLQSESEKVTFIDLVEFFCRIELERDIKLPQNVCKTCKNSLETFMFFCDTIEKHQKTLKLVKNEKVKADSIVIIQEQKPEILEKDNTEVFNEENDEDLDSNDCGESTTSASESTSHFNLRKKTLPEMKEVKIVLERLDIKYEHSDTEGPSDDEEEEAKPIKRQRCSSGSVDLSPSSKRMRISSPVKVKQEKPTTVQTVQQVKQVTWKDFKSYHKFFEAEFIGDYNDSQFNLPVPRAAKLRDGSLLDAYAEKFKPWSAIELKCTIKPCFKKFNSPYELLLHNRNCHPGQSEKFIKCPTCTSSEDFSFSEYFQHAIALHFRHLRYCCVMCSKMFYNFTALFHHYGNSHPSFTDIKMCLYDGLLFENYGKLEKHVAIHVSKSKLTTMKKDKASDSTSSAISITNNNNKFDCDACDSIFKTLFHLEFHKKAYHSRQYNCNTCDKAFSSSFSLIMHENEAHC